MRYLLSSYKYYSGIVGNVPINQLFAGSSIPIDTRRRCKSSNSYDDTNNGGTNYEPTASTKETSPLRKNTRQRHRFNKNNSKSFSIAEIPSFHDFQRSMQIRTLYRQYIRLIGLYNRKNKNTTTNTASAGTDKTTVVTASSPKLSLQQQLELQNQVRTEFKQHQNSNHTNDVFYIQKSLAEGQRRYKELYSMIHGGTTMTTASAAAAPTNHPVTSSSSPPSATESYWPWNKTAGNNNRSSQQQHPATPSSSDSSFPLKFPPKSNS